MPNDAGTDPYVNNRAFLGVLRELGVGEKSARGALGSLAWESGSTLDNGATNAGDGADGSDSIGWGQWNASRGVALRSTAASMGLPWTDPRAQTQHIRNELTGPYKHVLEALKSQDDFYHGASVWTRDYENPAVKNVDQRYGRALELAGKMGADLSNVLPMGRPTQVFNTAGSGLGDNPGDLSVPASRINGYQDLWSPVTADDTRQDTRIDGPLQRRYPITSVAPGPQQPWSPQGDTTQDEKMAHREATTVLWAGAGKAASVVRAAYSTSSLTASILRAGSLSNFEPSAAPYRMTTAELERRTHRLGLEYHSWFERAVSPEHADAIERTARQNQHNREILDKAGWAGTAAGFLASVLDPTALAAGYATGALGNLAVRAAGVGGGFAGVASRVAINAVVGAGSNVAIDAGLHAAGDPEEHNLKVAALTGALFGGAFGLLSHGPASNGMVRAARRGLGEDHPTDASPRRPEIGATGPEAEAPTIVTPKGTGEVTGTPEVDAAVARTRADGTSQGHEVPTQIVRLHPQVDDVASLVQELAAKFGVGKLVKVGRVEDMRGYDNALGLLQRFDDGTYALRVNVGRTTPQERVEAALHEFGHLLDHEFFGDVKGKLSGGTLTPEIAKAYAQWRVRAQTQSIGEFFHEYFGPALGEKFAKGVGVAKDLAAADMADWRYRAHPAEWFAQEVGKWAVSTEQPRSVIERIFAKIADYWRKLYTIAKGDAPRSSDAVAEFLNKRYDAGARPAAGYEGPAAVAALDSPQTAVAQFTHVNPGPPKLAPEGGLGAILSGTEAAPETAFGNARFSIAAELGRSKNPAVRALGNVLVEDTVGKQRGAATAHSTELWATQRTKSAQVHVAQTRKAAWETWRKENGLGFFEARKREGEFEELVSKAIRGADDPAILGTVPDSIKVYAGHLSKIMDRARKLANDPFLDEGFADARPVGGFGTVPEDSRYLTRVFSAQKIANLMEQHGEARLVGFMKEAIRSAQPLIEDRLLDKMAKGYVRNTYKRALGVIDEKVARMFAVDNLEHVRDDLMHMHGLSQDDADAVIRSLRGSGEGGKDVRAKRRVLLDENYREGDLAVSDFLVNNATALTNAYVRHMYGKVALARVRIPDGEGGFLVNGITNEGDWNSLLDHIRRRGHDERIPARKTEGEIDALQTAYDQITGNPHPLADEDWAKAVRVAGKLNLARLGHQFVFAQAGEVYNMIANLGLNALMKQAPSFRRIMTADGQWIKAQGLDHEIESIFGLGADRIRMTADVHHADELRSLPMEAAGFWDRADRALNTAGHAVLELSGFHLLDGAMKQWTAKAIAQKFADMARRASELPNGTFDTAHVNYQRMAQMGLDDAMLQRVIRGVKDHFSVEGGHIFADVKVTRMNLDKWADQEARIAFEQALMRHSRFIIQENDIGSMHKWMSHPLWRMIMQFRAFPLHAWDKQLMHNLAMHDTQSMNAAVLGAAIPALIYSMQQGIASIGRDDADKWLSKRLDTEHLLSAAFQRHGWSSMLPTIIDSAMPFVGRKPVFDSRTTQQQADLVFGNPTASLAGDVSKATGAVVNSFASGRKLSQDEFRDIHRLFGNNLVTGSLLNMMIQGREVHPPRMR